MIGRARFWRRSLPFSRRRSASSGVFGGCAERFAVDSTLALSQQERERVGLNEGKKISRTDLVVRPARHHFLCQAVHASPPDAAASETRAGNRPMSQPSDDCLAGLLFVGQVESAEDDDRLAGIIAARTPTAFDSAWAMPKGVLFRTTSSARKRKI